MCTGSVSLCAGARSGESRSDFPLTESCVVSSQLDAGVSANMSKSHEQQLKWRDTEVEELIASMKERE